MNTITKEFEEAYCVFDAAATQTYQLLKEISNLNVQAHLLLVRLHNARDAAGQAYLDANHNSAASDD